MEDINQFRSSQADLPEERNIDLEEILHHQNHTIHVQNLELQILNEELTADREELFNLNEKLVEASALVKKQSEAIVQQKEDSQYLLDKANEVAQIGSWCFDSSTGFSDWNKTAMKILGWPTNSTPGYDDFLDRIHPEDRDQIALNTRLTFHESKPYDIEHRIIRMSDGQTRWIHCKAALISNEKHSRLLIGVIQDITERKTAEEALVGYNKLYELLSKATNDAIWDWDIESDIETWNHGIQTMFGYTTQKADFPRIWWSEKIHPNDYERVNTEIKNAFAQGKSNWTSHYQYRCADGNYKHVLDRAYIIYHANKPIRMIGAIQDITTQKKFEHDLMAIARELSELIENANTPIFGTDRNGYINEWNKVTAELTGYSKNEVLGKKLPPFIKQPQRVDLTYIFNQVIADQPASNLQIPMISKDHRNLTILLNATPRKNLQQQINGVLMVGQDITELIEYRQNLEIKVQERTNELYEALRKEKELVEMKSKFVSIASHEFRTPLSTIALVSGFLRKHREKLTHDEFNSKLSSIEKQVNHMTYLLDDILLIGKTEAGKIQTQFKTINIEQFFQQTSREVEESALTHAIQIQMMCSINEFRSDEKFLRNILINLLTNAIKFSPKEKSISLRVSNSADSLKIEVEDNGIGITEKDMHLLFTAFHRGSNVGVISGTGLGLSIVKKAVDLLQGSIEIYSKGERGTLFTVTLPLHPS